jgi:hypothetical protein
MIEKLVLTGYVEPHLPAQASPSGIANAEIV